MDWERVIVALTSGGVSAGAVFVLMIIMLARGQLWTNSAHNQVVKVMNDRIAELELDRDQWRASAGTERTRGDELQVRVSEEVVPLLRVTNSLLESIRAVGGEVNGS